MLGGEQSSWRLLNHSGGKEAASQEITFWCHNRAGFHPETPSRPGDFALDFALKFLGESKGLKEQKTGGQASADC